jgi:hypothetical protein
MSRLALPCVGMETRYLADASQSPIVTAANRTRHEPPGYRAFKALIAQIHGLTPNPARGGKRVGERRDQRTLGGILAARGLGSPGGVRDHCWIPAEKQEGRWLQTTLPQMFRSSTAVSIGRPAARRRNLHLSQSGVEWVVSAYILVFAGLLLLFSDIAGDRNRFPATIEILLMGSWSRSDKAGVCA